MDLNVTINPQELRESIGRQWLSRAKEQELKPGTAKYRRAEIEFFCGAMAALNAVKPNKEHPELIGDLVPRVWAISIMTGRPVVKS